MWDLLDLSNVNSIQSFKYVYSFELVFELICILFGSVSYRAVFSRESRMWLGRWMHLENVYNSLACEVGSLSMHICRLILYS